MPRPLMEPCEPPDEEPELDVELVELDVEELDELDDVLEDDELDGHVTGTWMSMQNGAPNGFATQNCWSRRQMPPGSDDVELLELDEELVLEDDEDELDEEDVEDEELDVDELEDEELVLLVLEEDDEQATGTCTSMQNGAPPNGSATQNCCVS